MPRVMPTKYKPYGDKLVAEVSGCQIYDSGMRYILCKDGYWVSRVLKRTVDNKFKGDFEAWIETVKGKDLAKAKKFRRVAAEIVNECEDLERLWDAS